MSSTQQSSRAYTAATTLAAIALFASVSGLASADSGRRGGDDRPEDKGKHKGWVIAKPDGLFTDKRDRETGVEFKNDGTVVLRGAKVTAVSASNITVTETLGAVTLTWTATISPTTKIESKNGKPLAVTEITAGDTVTVKGAMVSGNSLALAATLVRDVTKSVTTPVVNTQQVFEGTVSVLPGATLPTTLTILIGTTPQIVNVTNTTTVLNTAWSPVALSLFQVGDTVRVFGFIPAVSTVVNGIVVRNTTR
jgi:hypothetical protein